MSTPAAVTFVNLVKTGVKTGVRPLVNTSLQQFRHSSGPKAPLYTNLLFPKGERPKIVRSDGAEAQNVKRYQLVTHRALSASDNDSHPKTPIIITHTQVGYQGTFEDGQMVKEATSTTVGSPQRAGKTKAWLAADKSGLTQAEIDRGNRAFIPKE